MSNLHESTDSVVACLTTRIISEFAFVDIFAGSSVSWQYVANFAGTFFLSSWGRDADLARRVCLACMNCRTILFIFALHAILVTIADVLLIDAVVLSTFSRRNNLRGTWKLTSIALHIAIGFVFTAFTIRLAITNPVLRNATRVFARIFIIGTLSIVVANVTAIFLIFTRITILLLVTPPSKWDASSIVALKLVRSATDGFLRAVFFIRPISAIVVTIASEALENATTARASHSAKHSFALEFTLRTVWQWEVAAQLVTSIVTIRLAIAFKS